MDAERLDIVGHVDGVKHLDSAESKTATFYHTATLRF